MATQDEPGAMAHFAVGYEGVLACLFAQTCYVLLFVCLCIYTYIYIYIYIERERERDIYVHMYIYIYIYIYTTCLLPLSRRDRSPPKHTQGMA